MKSKNTVSDTGNTDSEKPLEIVFRVSNIYTGYLIIAVYGSIDTYSKNYFKETVCRVIANGNAKIIIDLENVFFISGTGVGTFVHLERSTSKKGGDMILTGLGGQIIDIFQILGITDVFNIVSKNKLPEMLPAADNLNTLLPEKCPVCSSRIKFDEKKRISCPSCKSVIEAGRIRSYSV